MTTLPSQPTAYRRNSPPTELAAMMTAVVADGHGSADMLRATTVPIPRPQDDEVLVRGGRDVAGVVTEVGAGVRDVGVGDEVYGIGRGTFAQFTVVDVRRLARKPVNHVTGVCSRLRAALTPTGTAVLVGEEKDQLTGGMVRQLRGLALSSTGRRRFAGFLSRERDSDLQALTALSESGRVTPHVDRSFALSEAAEAMRHLESGAACGKIAVLPPTCETERGE